MGNVEIITGVYEAFGRGDIEGVLATFDPQIEWREAEGNPYQLDGSAWIGGAAVTENLFVKLGTEWDGFTVSPIAFRDADDTVVVEVRYTGTYKATGKGIDAQACHVWTLRDGSVTNFQQYVDTSQMQAAMGVPAAAGELAGAAPG